MRIKSLIRSQFTLVPIELELTLVPGLPQIQILGLPDLSIRESVVRIKSALRAQGFQFPVAQQVLVNLKPSHLRKHSRGLDLAIAASLLFETGQVDVPRHVDELIFYGELSLTGEVSAPDDIENYGGASEQLQIVTGLTPPIDLPVQVVRTLRDLNDPVWPEVQSQKSQPVRPVLESISFSKPAALAMAIVSCGEHSALVAGPQGTGKTTWSSRVHSVLRPPDPSDFRFIRQLSRQFGDDVTWRPFVCPHHSATPLAIIGGGVPPTPGQMTRAHGGVLLLDELLQYPRAVQEALREPVEAGRIVITRAGGFSEFPADFLLLSTTNLCACGKFVPHRAQLCVCSNYRRQEYLQRLSGPVLDRFQVVVWSHDWNSQKDSVSLSEIHERVERGRSFAQHVRGQKTANSRLNQDFLDALDTFSVKHLMPDVSGSRRRKLACARVARTVADLDLSEAIKPWHWQQAYDYAVHPFAALERSRALGIERY